MTMVNLLFLLQLGQIALILWQHWRTPSRQLPMQTFLEIARLKSKIDESRESIETAVKEELEQQFKLWNIEHGK